MFNSIFKNEVKKTFTFFIPSAKVHGTAYREKTLDSVTQLFIKHNVEFKIETTISNNYGFWVLFILTSKESNFQKLESDQQFLPHTLNTESSRDFELIGENDEDFNDYDNFQV